MRLRHEQREQDGRCLAFFPALRLMLRPLKALTSLNAHLLTDTIPRLMRHALYLCGSSPKQTVVAGRIPQYVFICMPFVYVCTDCTILYYKNTLTQHGARHSSRLTPQMSTVFCFFFHHFRLRDCLLVRDVIVCGQVLRHHGNSGL